VLGFYHIGWVNIDNDPGVEADLHEDAEVLPSIANESVDEIYAGHIAEHIVDLKGGLSRWYEVLKPGGKITITVPDLIGATKLWKEDKDFPAIDLPADYGIVAVLVGGHIREECVNNHSLHRRAFDYSSLALCMEAVGFVDLKEVDNHPLMVVPSSKLGWQVAIEAKRPERPKMGP